MRGRGQGKRKERWLAGGILVQPNPALLPPLCGGFGAGLFLALSRWCCCVVVVPPLYDRFGTSLFFSWLFVSVVVVWRWFFFSGY
jgi:hypothetical protein